jgi:flagellar basal-body rod protein FlgG
MGVRSNNLANALTPGFRAQRVEQGTVAGGGTRVAATRGNPREGLFQKTNSTIDLAIRGDGFFRLQTPEGVRLTRTGSFSVDSEGTLVDAQGASLTPLVQVPEGTSTLAIGGDGRVTALGAGGTEQEVGRIELVSVENPQGLVQEGGNRLVPGPSTGQTVQGTPGQNGLGTLVSGFLEGSNVDWVEEHVGLLEDANYFRVNLISLKIGDEILGALLDIDR